MTILQQKYSLNIARGLKFLALQILMLPLGLIYSLAQEPQEEKPIPENVIVYMERTECYGTCPAYALYVYEDGTAEYHGKKYVERKGKYQAEVLTEKLEELQELFLQYDFFEYEDKYTELITDLPTTFIYFSHEGDSKKITDYHGAPDSLKKLEKEIDKFIQSLHWEKIKE